MLVRILSVMIAVAAASISYATDESLKVCSREKSNCQQLLNHAEFSPSKGVTKVRYNYTPVDRTYRPWPDMWGSKRQVEPVGCADNRSEVFYTWYDENNKEILQPHFLKLNHTYSVEISLRDSFQGCDKVLVDFPAVDYQSTEDDEPSFRFQEKEPKNHYVCKTDATSGQITYISELSTLKIDKISYKLIKENGAAITGIATVTDGQCDFFNDPGCVEGNITANDFTNKVNLFFYGRTGLLSKYFGGLDVKGFVQSDNVKQPFSCYWK